MVNEDSHSLKTTFLHERYCGFNCRHCSQREQISPREENATCTLRQKAFIFEIK